MQLSLKIFASDVLIALNTIMSGTYELPKLMCRIGEEMFCCKQCISHAQFGPAFGG